MEHVAHRVEALLAEILSVEAEEVGPLFRLEEVAPIDVARWVIACEGAFKIDIPDEEVHRFVHVQDLALRVMEILDA